MTPGFRLLVLLSGLFLTGDFVRGAAAYDDLESPAHNYWNRTPADRFTKLKTRLESDPALLVLADRRNESDYLASLLELLEIPSSSQLLVFSTSSLQSGLITPLRPRAIYFNEDTYLGFIPGGKIEIVSVDPDLGAIFYIFDIPRGGPARPDRSGRCMNCHAGAETGWVPGLSVKSVIPGPNGGSLTAFRVDVTGHAIPFKERFGGWYLTGKHHIPEHQANLVGRFAEGQLVTERLDPATAFDRTRYLLETSDILPHLLLEHQAGFINRTVEATYRTRARRHADGETLTAEHAKELDDQADLIVRYLLFADETELPGDGVEGAPGFIEDFRRNRRQSAAGLSLKDFDLNTRLFLHRCSYMIYSPSFRGLPPEMTRRVLSRLGRALSWADPDPEYGYLPEHEKRAIRSILAETLEELPESW